MIELITIALFLQSLVWSPIDKEPSILLWIKSNSQGLIYVQYTKWSQGDRERILTFVESLKWVRLPYGAIFSFQLNLNSVILSLFFPWTASLPCKSHGSLPSPFPSKADTSYNAVQHCSLLNRAAISGKRLSTLPVKKRNSNKVRKGTWGNNTGSKQSQTRKRVG